MPSKDQLVREALATEVRKVVGIGTVMADGFWQLWNQETAMPAAYVILDSDSKDRSPTRSKEVSASFRIATTLRSEKPQDAFDTLRAAIETEIEDDPGLGGLVRDAWVSGCGPFATAKSISGDFYVRNIFVDVSYRYPRAQP